MWFHQSKKTQEVKKKTPSAMAKGNALHELCRRLQQGNADQDKEPGRHGISSALTQELETKRRMQFAESTPSTSEDASGKKVKAKFTFGREFDLAQ